MPDPMFTNSQIMIYGIIGGVFILGIFLILKFYKKDKGFKDFNPFLFSDCVTEELKKRMNLEGKKIKKGKIIIDFNVIAHVDKYYKTKGNMPLATYDEKEKDFKLITDEKGEEIKIIYDFSVFRLKNKNIIYRIFGLKKSFMIMRNKDDEGNILIRFDDKTSRMFFPKNVEFDSYGNIWNESQTAKEYLNNISFLEMLQQMQTHLQNIPNRTVHLEIEQAKKERLYNTLAEIEKAKYEKIKGGEDTVVS